jgi:hypothetical protein
MIRERRPYSSILSSLAAIIRYMNMNNLEQITPADSKSADFITDFFVYMK